MKYLTIRLQNHQGQKTKGYHSQEEPQSHDSYVLWNPDWKAGLMIINDKCANIGSLTVTNIPYQQWDDDKGMGHMGILYNIYNLSVNLNLSVFKSEIY